MRGKTFMSNAQWDAVNNFLREKIASFGCPDSFLTRTADSMTNSIDNLLKTNKDIETY